MKRILILCHAFSPVALAESTTADYLASLTTLVPIANYVGVTWTLPDPIRFYYNNQLGTAGLTHSIMTTRCANEIRAHFIAWHTITSATASSSLGGPAITVPVRTTLRTNGTTNWSVDISFSKPLRQGGPNPSLITLNRSTTITSQTLTLGRCLRDAYYDTYPGATGTISVGPSYRVYNTGTGRMENGSTITLNSVSNSAPLYTETNPRPADITVTVVPNALSLGPAPTGATHKRTISVKLTSTANATVRYTFSYTSLTHTTETVMIDRNALPYTTTNTVPGGTTTDFSHELSLTSDKAGRVEGNLLIVAEVA